MAWIELKQADIESRLSTDELESWNDAGQEEGSEISRVPGIIQQTVGLVRGRVASCRDNQLGAAGLIPEELLWAAATIAKYALLNSIPTGAEQIESRNNENRQAHDMLNQAASCELLITGDDGESTANQVQSTYGGDCRLEF